MNSPVFLLNFDWSRPTTRVPTTTMQTSGDQRFLTFATMAMVSLTMSMPCETSTALISSVCLWIRADTVESGICHQARVLPLPSLLFTGTVQRDTIPLVTRSATTWVATTTSRTPALLADTTMGTRIPRQDSVPFWPMTVAAKAVLVFSTFRIRTSSISTVP